MPEPTAAELAAGVTYIRREELTGGLVIACIGGERHEVDHVEAGEAPLHNPDPERLHLDPVVVGRDGWRMTIRSAYVPVLGAVA